MKVIPSLLPAALVLGLASCGTTVSQSPVHTAPLISAPVSKPVSKPKPEGALRQVSPGPAKPKAYPDIPLKPDTGVSPLIHTKADTPTYQRSNS